jgi:hypothetical protein
VQLQQSYINSQNINKYKMKVLCNDNSVKRRVQEWNMDYYSERQQEAETKFLRSTIRYRETELGPET